MDSSSSDLERQAFVTLNKNQRERFKESSKCQMMKQGQVIFDEEESAKYVYLIDSGHVRISRSSAQGTIVTVSIRNYGDLIGVAEVLSGMNRCCFAEALETCEIWKMDGKSFGQMLYTSPELSMKVMTALGTRLREAENTIFNLATLEVGRRLAKLLLDLAQKHPCKGDKGLKIEVRLSHQELSTMIGTCRQTVTTTLQKFKKNGLIHTGKMSVEILDIEGLKEFANG